jgi:hypothetical protein
MQGRLTSNRMTVILNGLSMKSRLALMMKPNIINPPHQAHGLKHFNLEMSKSALTKVRFRLRSNNILTIMSLP